MNLIQQKIYQIYKENNGSLPTYRNLAKALNVSSLNTISYHINQLKKNGYFSINFSKQAIVQLNLKNLLNFENQSGVYAIFKDKTPLAVESSENIKKSLIEKINEADSPFISYLKENPEKIFIAYSLIEDSAKRTEMKKYLSDLYSLA